MKTTFRSSFLRDLKNIRDSNVLARIEAAILDVENAASLAELRSLRKLSGHKDLYRIRVGDHRLGVSASDNEVEFVRALHRKDIYRSFP